MSPTPDWRPRVVWASKRLTANQKGLWCLVRDLGRLPKGAVADAQYLGECLGLAAGTITNERATLHRAGLLDDQAPRGRRQLHRWFEVLPAECTPTDGRHETILRCAAALDAYLAKLPDFAPRPHRAVRPNADSGPNPEVSPRPNPGVSTSTWGKDGMGGIPHIPSSPQDEGIQEHGALEGAPALDDAVRPATASPQRNAAAIPHVGDALRSLEADLSDAELRHLAADARRRHDDAQAEKLGAILRRRMAPKPEADAA